MNKKTLIIIIISLVCLNLLINTVFARPFIKSIPTEWNGQVIKGTTITQSITIENPDNITYKVHIELCVLPPETIQKYWGFGSTPLSITGLINTQSCFNYNQCDGLTLNMQPDQEVILTGINALALRLPDETVSNHDLWIGTGRYVLGIFLTNGCNTDKPYIVYEGKQIADLYLINETENKCGNEIIDTGENCFNCPLDVSCVNGYACSHGDCLIINASHECGNNVCEIDENLNCPKDCPKQISIQYLFYLLIGILIIITIVLIIKRKHS
jgi:hypothetical protein